jgi:transposase
MKKNCNTKYVGLDVHKDTIVIAIADEGRAGEIRSYGTIPHTTNALDKFLRKQISQGAELRCVYEAGPTGFGLYHYLQKNGVDCVVVAPSMIPKKSGVKIKNDRRDAQNLARLHRAGDLTAIYVPEPEDEAMRDLIRGRDDARVAARKAKQRLLSFLLKHGWNYSGKTKWTQAHYNWLSDIKMGHPAQQIALQEYITSVEETNQRVSRLTAEITKLVREWQLEPIVTAIQALRGVSLLTAATVIAEVGPLARFAKPTELMSYLGLVPSEHSSGTTIKRGGITKAGNGYARRALVEASWTYRFPARVTRHLLKRSHQLPKPVREIAWKAQVRLCDRFRRLSAKGKPKQVVTTAIARELIAFIWAISNEVAPVVDGKSKVSAM